MKHIWTILCQSSSVDVDTNILSLFNCIEELNLTIDKTQLIDKEKLVIPVGFQMVSFWAIEDHSRDNILEIKGEIIDPNGKSLNKFDNKFSIKKGALRFRSRINIQGLPVTKEGRYIIRIMQKMEKNKDFEVVTELPLDVKISYTIKIK